MPIIAVALRRHCVLLSGIRRHPHSLAELPAVAASRGKWVRRAANAVRDEPALPTSVRAVLDGGCSGQEHQGRIVIGYWRHRCLSGAIRLLLAHAWMAFVEHRYELGNPPDFDWGCWAVAKERLRQRCAHPNLPYMIDGDRVLVQHNTILRYLARKAGLAGTSPNEEWQADSMLGVVYDDLIGGLCDVTYAPAPVFAKKLEAYKMAAPGMLACYEHVLSDGRAFLAGGLGPTHCDFFAYEFFDQLRHVVGSTLFVETPRIAKFVGRIEGLASIQALFAAPEYLSRPLHNRHSNFVDWHEGVPQAYTPVCPARVQVVHYPP